MSEYLKLRALAELDESTSTASPGPHFGVQSFDTATIDRTAAALDTAPTTTDHGPLTTDNSPLLSQVQLSAIGLKKNYRKGSVDIPVLGGVDLEVRRGEFLAIVGQSGSGKSTLLHLLGTLDAPTAGEVRFDDRRIDNLPAAERDRMRNTMFGMIFQFYHLLPELTMLENVLSPLMIRHGFFGYRRRRREFVAVARELLDLVGLSHRLKHRPRELSGGEMQRTAIARALISGPQILLADEPTGNLDQETGLEIMRILRTLNSTQKLSIVMVTHDMAIAAEADRIVRLVAGRVQHV